MTDSGRCPSPEQIAAFVAGSLAGEELTMVMDHIRTCNDCRLVLADAAMIDRTPELAETGPHAARPSVAMFEPSTTRCFPAMSRASQAFTHHHRADSPTLTAHDRAQFRRCNR